MSNTSWSVVPSGSSASLSVFSNRRYRTYAGISVVGFLWLFGLFSVFLSPAPMGITTEMQKRYDIKLEEALKVEARRHIAHEEYMRAHMHTNEAKVWFWWFKSAARKEVRERQVPEKEAYGHYRALDAQYRAAIQDAKSELGIWTVAGVGEIRHLFWESYKTGKLLAQKQTLFDILELLFYGDRDADPFLRLIQFLALAVCNFATATVSSLFVFIAGLPCFILSFNPGFWSGLLFFLTCLIGSISVIGTILLLLSGSFVAVVFAMDECRGEIGYRAPYRRTGRYRRRRLNHRSHFD